MDGNVERQAPFAFVGRALGPIAVDPRLLPVDRAGDGIARLQKRRLYRLQDSINSLSCGVSEQVVDLGMKVWSFGSYVFLYDALRLFELDAASPWVWIAGALGVDLMYYWFHRASHRVGFLWAAHVVHHQSEEYNLSTALRQAHCGNARRTFCWPLAIVRLPPKFLTLATLGASIGSGSTRGNQAARSNRARMNTPSHHHVHPAIDQKHHKNYAGVLIVWDRLFGVQREEEEPAYGTVKPSELEPALGERRLVDAH
jgi:sterol desaturase/sphingolipid hydroxylase (fatty acid hydroxylase superfamily)